jgi:hypothetical protein
MKVAKQSLLAVGFYIFCLAVSPAGAAPQLSLSSTTGQAGQFIVVYGSGFYPSTQGFVFFDHNFDFQLTTGTNWKCGYLSNKDCEPSVQVNTDSSGNFTTSIAIPPGKKVDFLGAGTYFIAAQLPIGGGSDAWTPFKVLGEFGESKPYPFDLSYRPAVAGRNFAPFTLSGQQSQGRVWFDIDGDYGFYFDPNEPGIGVWVLTDGTLSTCQTSACPIANPFNGRPYKGHVRVDIVHEADQNRSADQKVEASFVMMCSSSFGC